jgi:hypothetical protein
MRVEASANGRPVRLPLANQASWSGSVPSNREAFGSRGQSQASLVGYMLTVWRLRAELSPIDIHLRARGYSIPGEANQAMLLLRRRSEENQRAMPRVWAPAESA